jgi:hypothetical protein
MADDNIIDLESAFAGQGDAQSPDQPVVEPTDTNALYGSVPQRDITPADLTGLGVNQFVTPTGPNNIVDLGAAFAGGSFRDSTPIPPSDELTAEVNEKVTKVLTLLDKRGINIFTTQDVMQNLQTMSYVPEVAWVLDMGEPFIEDIQAAVFTSFLDSIDSVLKDKPETAPNELNTRALVSMFWKNHGSKFSTQERELLTAMWSAIPHGSEFLRQAAAAGENPTQQNLPFNPGIGPVNAENLLTGVNFLRKAPQDVRNIVQDPREKIVALATQWLDNNPMDTFEDREKFIVKQYQWVQQEIANHKEASGFWGRLGARLEAPFVALADFTSEQVAEIQSGSTIFGSAASPEEFAVRQHLSFGQNLAISLGHNPASDDKIFKLSNVGFSGELGEAGIGAWDFFSGAGDLALNLSPVDPINLAVGVGTGLSMSRTVARADDLGRAASIYKSLKPFSGGRGLTAAEGGLPVLSRGTLARVTWSLTSRQVDDLVEARRFRKFYKFIAETDNAAELLPRLPDQWKKSDDLVDALARTKDTEFVKELIRAGLQGWDVGGFEKPLLTVIQSTWKADAERGYKAALNDALTNEKLGLGQVATGGIDAIDTNLDGVWRIADTNVLGPLAAGDIPKSLAGRIVPENPSVVQSVNRNVGRIATSGNKVASKTLLDGRTVEVFKNGDIVALRVDDTIVGGAAKGQVGVDPEFSATAEVFTKDGSSLSNLIGDALGSGGIKRLIESVETGGGTLSEAGLGFLQREARRSGATNQVLRQSDLVDDGGLKIVVAKNNIPNWKVLNVDSNTKFLGGLSNWLTSTIGTKESTNLSAKLHTSLGFRGSVLDSLNPQELALLNRYAEMTGMTAIRAGDGMIVTSKGQRALLVGKDLSADVGLFEDVMRTPAANLAKVDSLARSANSSGRAHLWAIADMPREKRASRIMNSVKTRSRTNKTNAVLRAMRRGNAHLTMKLPGNISFVKTGEGADSLERWIRFLGGSKDTALKWVQEFRNANPANRNRVVQDALVAVGDEIDNDMLRLNLINWSQKQGQQTFFFNRAGNELGQSTTAEGASRIRPMTISHFTKSYAMPDAQQLLKTVARGRGAKRFGKNSRMVRGIMGSTRKTRKDMAERYRDAARRRAPAAGIGMNEDDWLRMAYADVLGFENFGRGNGLGYTAKMAKIGASPFKAFHSVFTVSQLALRAIPWATRIGLEENVRANFVGLPTLWRRPKQFMSAWFDAKAIRSLPDDISKQGKAINGIIEEIFDPKLGPDAILDDLRTVVKDLDELIEARGINPQNLSQVKALTASELGRELIGGDAMDAASFGLRTNISRRTLLRNRRIKRRTENLKARGFDPKFSFEMDAPDILNRSFFSQWIKEADSSTQPLAYSIGNMTDKDVVQYGRAYGRQIYQMMGDPIISQWGFGRALARTDGAVDAARWSPQRLAASKWFDDVLPNVREHVGDLGLEFGSRVELAEWYLDNVVDEIVETLFRPMFIDELGDPDFTRQAQVLSDLVNNRTLNVSFDGGNFTFKHSGDNYEQGLGVVSDFTEAAYRRNIQLPPRISAWFDPRFGQGEDTRNMFRRFTDYTLQRFGEDATQKFMRQPAFVHVFDKEFQRLKGYGWAEDVARVHATEKATETINWIFFNNNSNTAFLRRMNNIVPFFSAWWEVMSTWAFKIPSQTFMPLGYTALARRVDRFFQGMRETGLIEQDENGQMFLNFQDNLGGNTAGAALSKIGRTMTRTPVTIAEWLGGIGKLAVDAVDGDGIHFDKFEPVDLSAFAKDGFFINVASPLDLSGNTHGVMGINNFQFGLTPVLSYVATQALERSGFAGDIKLKDTEKELPFFSEEGDSILSIIDGNQDISLNQFINLNHDALEEAWGRERLNRIKSGFISGEEVTIPKGTYKVPETSLFTQLIDDTFFPFGRMHTPGEAIVAVTPSTISYILRGLGIHSNDDDPNLITVMLTGMQGAFGEQGQYQVDAEVLKQIQYLEATEGLVSKVQEKAAELRILVTQTVEAGNEIPIGGLEEGLPRILSDDHPRAEEAQDILDDLTRLNSEIVRRAEDNAGWALIVRGITGSLGPSTPRMFFKEQEDAANYWVSRDIAKEAEVRGSVNFARLLEETKVRNFSDLSNALTLVGEWLEDPVGDQAKVFVKENHPSMFSFIQGSTFWGDGGPPPEIGTIEEFFRQVESGERQVYSPDVFVQRVARAEIATDREIAIINEYGDDYLTQAQAQLTDWSKWRDLTEPYSRAYEGLDWMDQTLNDGAYLDFNNRNKDDRSTFYELIRDEFNKAVENVDEVLNAVDFLGLSPDDQRQVSGILNSSTRGIRDAIKEFDEKRNL